jgi:DNA-binding PadR family transcriptional regulator
MRLSSTSESKPRRALAEVLDIAEAPVGGEVLAVVTLRLLNSSRRIVQSVRFETYYNLSTVSIARLSTTSYAVLGLLELCQPATPYQLKQAAQVSIFHFWTITHTQLYTECARLAEAGLLGEEREEGGRRRRVYRLTDAGLNALDRWRASTDTELYELRDPGLLKLFCGSDPVALAETQLERHEQRLGTYEELAEQDMTPGMRLALDAGTAHEREYVRFWSEVREGRRS